MKCAQQVAGDAGKACAPAEFRIDVAIETADDLQPVACRSRVAKEVLIGHGETKWVLVGFAAEHDTIDPVKMLLCGAQAGHSTVDDHLQCRKIGLQPVDAIIVQWRYLAILLRAQALQPGFARMHNQSSAARLGNLADEVT